MERIKNMGLKKAFFLLAVMCLLGSLLLTAAVWLSVRGRRKRRRRAASSGDIGEARKP